MWRRASDAWRDRALVFPSATQGRPLELVKRLELGKLADGHWTKGQIEGSDGNAIRLDVLEATVREGHMECAAILQAARQRDGQT